MNTGGLADSAEEGIIRKSSANSKRILAIRTPIEPTRLTTKRRKRIRKPAKKLWKGSKRESEEE